MRGERDRDRDRSTNEFNHWLDGAPSITMRGDGDFEHWLNDTPVVDLIVSSGIPGSAPVNFQASGVANSAGFAILEAVIKAAASLGDSEGFAVFDPSVAISGTGEAFGTVIFSIKLNFEAEGEGEGFGEAVFVLYALFRAVGFSDASGTAEFEVEPIPGGGFRVRIVSPRIPSMHRRVSGLAFHQRSITPQIARDRTYG